MLKHSVLHTDQYLKKLPSRTDTYREHHIGGTAVPGFHNAPNCFVVKSRNVVVTFDLYTDFDLYTRIRSDGAICINFCFGENKSLLYRLLYENPAARKATLLFHSLFFKYLCLSHDILDRTLNVPCLLYTLSKGE
jgi:hypothetical protein